MEKEIPSMSAKIENSKDSCTKRINERDKRRSIEYKKRKKEKEKRKRNTRPKKMTFYLHIFHMMEYPQNCHTY